MPTGWRQQTVRLTTATRCVSFRAFVYADSRVLHTPAITHADCIDVYASIQRREKTLTHTQVIGPWTSDTDARARSRATALATRVSSSRTASRGAARASTPTASATRACGARAGAKGAARSDGPTGPRTRADSATTRSTVKARSPSPNPSPSSPPSQQTTQTNHSPHTAGSCPQRSNPTWSASTSAPDSTKTAPETHDALSFSRRRDRAPLPPPQLIENSGSRSEFLLSFSHFFKIFEPPLSSIPQEGLTAKKTLQTREALSLSLSRLAPPPLGHAAQ